MQIYLLTHSQELTKSTNTGQVAQSAASDWVTVIPWARTEPSSVLLDAIEQKPTALIYPSDAPVSVSEGDIEQFVIIDGTWQQARKIYNQSPYLHALPRITLTPSSPSIFNLRRNQLPNGLCTAECVSEVLLMKGKTAEANQVQQQLEAFIAKAPRNSC